MSFIRQEEFSEPTFDPKQWINSVLKKENSDETKETTILVTKLQMTSQDCSRQFDHLSNTVVKSMPRLLHDLKMLSEQAQGIQSKMTAAQQKLYLLKGETGECLNRLNKPHTVKKRMERCQELFDKQSTEIFQ